MYLKYGIMEAFYQIKNIIKIQNKYLLNFTYDNFI